MTLPMSNSIFFALTKCSNAQVMEGERIDDTFTLSANLASGKFAVIQKLKEFTLMP
jgi:hypothetical protein